MKVVCVALGRPFEEATTPAGRRWAPQRRGWTGGGGAGLGATATGVKLGFVWRLLQWGKGDRGRGAMRVGGRCEDSGDELTWRRMGAGRRSPAEASGALPSSLPTVGLGDLLEGSGAA
jgi:hypothetical protein